MNRAEAIETARVCAPYLCDSLSLYPELEARFQSENPAHICDELLSSLPPDISNLTVEMQLTRHLKRRLHLIVALADIAQIWSWVEVTEYLTRLADLTLLRILRAAAIEQGIDGTDDNPVPGLFLLAVGKYGARELNYSSDIDFNVFYDPQRLVLPKPDRAERTLIKLVQGVIRGCESMTEDGYLFRTDLRLRPDPRSNAIAVSVQSAERYYESLGQNWERAAMIKARVCSGDKAAGQEFCESVLEPFVWRRNLDYAAIEDILAIKRQINSRAGDSISSVAGHNLKLGAGGIREIEFYAQVQQLILGGREPSLREPRTVDALAALARGNFISEADCLAMQSHYAKLRKLEHTAQMMEDEQTHNVPEELSKREDFSRLAGYEDLQICEADIKSTLSDVRRIYNELFPDMETLSSEAGNMVFTGVEPDPETVQTLDKLGYLNSEAVWSDMSQWLGGRINATRTERARELLTILAPRILEFCGETGQPDRAFEMFGAFLTRLSGGVSVLSMFVQAPERLKFLISLMSRSEYVAESLAARPAILDALANPAFLELNLESLAEDYAPRISEAEDFEQALNMARRFVREDQFRVSSAVLSQRIRPRDAAPYFTKIATQCIRALLPASIAEASRVSEPAAGQVGVLGLGKLGGGELTLTSDLDIMVIYEAETETNAQRYVSKVTQRLINALSAVTEEGTLYEVDMALRPSGRAGPVAVPLTSFKDYYAHKAWTWEFMALSRSAAIASEPVTWQAHLQDARDQAISSPRPDLNADADIAEMLKLVKQEKRPRNDWDIKNRDGGLRDIEFIAQKLYLATRPAMIAKNVTSTQHMLDTASELGALDSKAHQKLSKALNLYENMAQSIGVCIGNLPSSIQPSDRENVSWLMGYDDPAALDNTLNKQCASVTKLVQKYIGLK